MSLILLALLLVMLSAFYFAIVLRISFLWRHMMKVSDLILWCVALVCGCVVTYMIS
jgi:hypothetical protein